MLRAAVALVALQTLFNTVQASQCTAFDSNNGAYVFGTTYGDYFLGQDDGLNQTTSYKALTNSSGRPDFSGNNTQCFTNQFTNGLYVINAVESEPDNVYIFNFGDSTWSTQATSGGPNSNVAILDHDTNVLYAYTNGNLNALSFDQEAAKSTGETIAWLNGASNNAPAFNTTGYQPVLGAANNHIQFLNTPGSSSGEAYIFVIHYAYWQPEVQSFGDFPVSTGQAVTIFSNSSSAPSSFAFVPDNATEGYIINAKTNSTTTFTVPPTTDSLARYSASTHVLLQLAPNGTLAYIDLDNPTSPWTSISLPTGVTVTSKTSSSNSGFSGQSSSSGASSLTKSTSSSAVSWHQRHYAIEWTGLLVILSLLLL